MREDDAGLAHVLEPTGEREFRGRLTIGGPAGDDVAAADVVVPGASPGARIAIERHLRDWLVEPLPAPPEMRDEDVAWRNGQRLRAGVELRLGDVLRLGEADVVVRACAPASLALDVRHLVGNATLPPLEPVAEPGRDDSDDDQVIRAAAGVDAAGETARRATALQSSGGPGGVRRWAVAGVAVALVVAVFAFLAQLVRVPLDVLPTDAKVRTADTFLSWQSGATLFTLPGVHRVRAEREGYLPAELAVRVADGVGPVRIRLAKTPGRLVIDTGGVAANVLVDGAPAGRAPGEITIGAGTRTVLLRADRRLDFVARLSIDGAGKRQSLKAQLKPSWGALRVASQPAGAKVTVDDREIGATPTSVELPAGVHRVRVVAPATRAWESSVVVKAAETLSLGPIVLGAADGQVLVRSTPSGADVALGGVLRGRTPLTLAVAPGANHEIVVTRGGYSSFSRTVTAQSGERVTVDARLTAISVGIAVRGEPADAEVLVDGVVRGRAPLTLALPAGEHRLEVRKEGLEPFVRTVPVAAGLVRTVEYRLLPPGKTAPPPSIGSTYVTKAGGVLKLLPAGTFSMGSDRREQGRRPNEQLRRVTLSRPFYVGVREVTNAEFRRFQSNHNSGFIAQKTVDLDAHPVTQVAWNDAVEFCNWLSEQEGLPPAYEKSGNSYVLKTPVTHGYRLPTEAEWEYAARLTSRGATRRFSWGDELPVPENAGNFAGAEAFGVVGSAIDGYKDDYFAVAPVGKFAQNGYGLYDVAGNVSEWVNDWYASFVPGDTVTDPLGPAATQQHVIRGASWRSGSVTELRLAWRDSAKEGSQSIGFRIVRYPEP